jgi:NAD(P)H-dependent flavin oxidoreductase YrpB (nitropropane dioxygenase family)
MLRTRFTDLVGCTVPLQQSPMGSFARPRLAAAVSAAGGLGMVVVTGASPARIAQRLDQALERSPGPIGANFFLLFSEPDTLPQCVATAASRAQVIDFFYQDPDPALVSIVHQHGALASWQVGSVEEAVAAEAAGCDFIVAQGVEAGGHVRGQISLLALLGEVLDAVSIPVLAAGGIGSGRAVAAVLAAGADGVRVGTRFVASEEAEAHPRYVDAVIAARAGDTLFADTFTYGYTGAPHRVLRASAAAAVAFQGEVVGEAYEPETGVTEPIHHLEKMTATRHASGTVEAMPHWAGESVSGVRGVQPAAAIIDELMRGAEQLLRRWC